MRCPVCRAAVEQGPACRRCRGDLTLLFTLIRHREQALSEAAQASMRGDLAAADAAVTRATRLGVDSQTRRWQAIVALLQRDFARAWQLGQH